MPAHRLQLFVVSAALASSAYGIGCRAQSASALAAGPIPLLGVPGNRAVRLTSAVFLGDTLFVAGNLLQSGADTLSSRPAYLGRVRQQAAGTLEALSPVDFPAGEFQFVSPRIVVAAGRLHLIWAEFNSRAQSAARWLSAIPTSLWHASRGPLGWSTPERIASSSWLGWSDEAGGVAVDGRGGIHISVWKGDSGTFPFVHHLRLAKTEWIDSKWRTGLNRASTLAASGDSVLISFVVTSGDTERVVVSQSIDRGLSWTTPVEVSQRSGANVSRVAFAAPGNNRVLSIAEKPSGAFFLDTLRLYRLGPTLAVAGKVITPLPSTSGGAEVAVESCGAISAVAWTLSQSPTVHWLLWRDLSSGASIAPLHETTGYVLYPAIGVGPRLAVAAFSYSAGRGMTLRAAAKPLRGCG